MDRGSANILHVFPILLAKPPERVKIISWSAQPFTTNKYIWNLQRPITAKFFRQIYVLHTAKKDAPRKYELPTTPGIDLNNRSEILKNWLKTIPTTPRTPFPSPRL